MTIGPASFLALAFIAIMAYLIYENRRLNTPAQFRQPPDVLNELVSASAEPGDRVGPGATGNSGWYTQPPASVIGTS